MASALPKAFMLSVIQIDRASGVPMHRQLYEGIRQAIIRGQLKSALRLPSSRDLARLLGVSRNTVLEAIDQLTTEGYLETRRGSGTYVTDTLPDDLLRTNADPPSLLNVDSRKRTIASRGTLYRRAEYTARRRTNSSYVFTVGVPALDRFPFNIWSRLLNDHYQSGASAILDYNVTDKEGYTPLRNAIAEYLQTARAVRCTPEQVIICNGSQQGMFIASQVLMDAGDKAWMEDPGHPGVHWVLRSAGAQVVPVPVDECGIIVEAGIAQAPDARLAVVTPSLQFPTGSTMNLKRRTELLMWASRNDAWIVEDDYNHEFRYVGHPLMSLQGLDTAGRVIYAGTFSKSMFPSLRIGYVVVPPDLIDLFTAARSIIDIQTPMVQQAALNDFIRQGHLARHIRRMRALYDERRKHLIAAFNEHLTPYMTLGIADAGMHIVGWLPPHIPDQEIARACEKAGVEVIAASTMCQGTPKRNGLVLGYAGATKDDASAGVLKLKAILQKYVPS
jgi:GntR family transcriptional regulator/MocR family aminotransferase